MTSDTVGDLGERALIDRIAAATPPPPDWVAVGPGDDAAVVEPDRNRLDVLSADSLIEGVHFDRQYVPPDAVGYKALAVNLSDLAAMGALPRVALLSLGLPAALSVADFDALVGGMLALASAHRVALVGGNIARSPGPLVVDLTVLGSVHRRRVLRRSGAHPGDLVYVSGQIGAAAAGFEALAAGRAGGFEACANRFLRPEPRVRLGLLAGRNQAASAAIDLSDGLADGLRQVASASDVGLDLDAAAIPIAEDARRWFEQRGADPLDAAIAGGEDYELLLVVPPRRRRAFEAVTRLAGIGCTRIGRVTRGPGIALARSGDEAPLPVGYTHFR